MASAGSHWLGIDIGGTFTDLVLHDTASGASSALKVLTTHGDPQLAVLRAVRQMLCAAALPATAISRVVHATTLFTNALIERRGAATGLITTAGFRDTLEIGRERKYDLYDIAIENPAPLVPRAWRQEVAERIGPSGAVIIPLDRDDLHRKLDLLQAEGVTSIAIVFLHSYADPTHEQAAADAIRAWAPALQVTASHEVVPEIREYDRASTTVASAYIKPLAARYLKSLSDELAGIGITAPLLLMLSNGGLTHVAEVIRNPVQMLESGPAAGALAAAFFGARDDTSELLGFDMGGTTAKLSLVEGGEPLIAYAFEAARQKRFMEGSGLPIRISTVELIEIGAGGGSIARADALGLLKVGPDSAGSEPGPVCYGQGGTQPTVTDANLLLGYLNPDFFRRRHNPHRRRKSDERDHRPGRELGSHDAPDSLRHPHLGERNDGRRRAGAHRRARPRSALLCAHADRRRRPGARLRRGAAARHLPPDLSPRPRRRLGLGPAGGAGAGRPGAHHRFLGARRRSRQAGRRVRGIGAGRSPGAGRLRRRGHAGGAAPGGWPLCRPGFSRSSYHCRKARTTPTRPARP